MTGELMITPGGPRSRSKVHLVAPNETLTVAKSIETTIKSSKQAGRPDQANWITAAWLDMSATSVKSFSTSWKVPDAPTSASSQLLYLFSGMEPANASTIVQPVLQWGNSGPDEDGKNRTGKFWTVASWIVPAPDGHTYHTPHVRVNPGESLVGVVTPVKKSAGSWVYACEFQAIAGTKFLTPPIPELTWCVEALEAYELSGGMSPPYDLNSPSEYPGTKFTAFEAIHVLADGKPSAAEWTVSNYQTKFGEHTEITANSSANGSVRVYYGADAAPGVPCV